MKRQKEARVEEEPIGIVISHGARESYEPRYSVYVWGPVPTENEESTRAA